MALIVLDRVRETSSSQSTNDMVLAGSVIGYQGFSAIGNGNTTYYCIAGQGTNEWEVGIGTYDSGTNTLQRTTVLSNSSGTEPLKLDFTSGTKDVFVTYPAEKSVDTDTSQTLTNKTLASGTAITAGTIDNAVIGGVTPAAGTFTTATATTGNITTVNATTVDTTNIEVTTLKAKDGTAAGSIADSTGIVTLTSSVLTTTDINGGTIDGTSIGVSTPSTGAFTNFSASGTADFTSTGSVKIPVGTTAQRPSPVAGMLRFNDDSDEFEGYNGTAWASVGGSAISNDTTTATDLFPSFLSATTGTAASIFTSNAKLLYKPSTGEFKAQELVATNGIVVNSATISANYTIPTGSNAMSAGPVSISDGVSVTVSDGSIWVVV